MYWAESSHALSRRLGSEWLTYFLRSFDYTACRLEEDQAGLAVADHHTRAAGAVAMTVLTK